MKMATSVKDNDGENGDESVDCANIYLREEEAAAEERFEKVED